MSQLTMDFVVIMVPGLAEHQNLWFGLDLSAHAQFA